MSCYGCGAEFSFFKKEHGCKNCGFAFCSNCLTKKTAVPKLNGSKHHVCNKCYDILTGKVSAKEKQQFSPPKAYVKRMEALQERESKGGATTAKSGASRPDPKYASLDKPDREIAQRLEKLKEKPEKQQAAVTDTDLNARLARLKGEDPAIRTAPTKPFYQPPDRRTQVEQIDDLLDEIANEVEIDSHRPDPATEVQARLDRLRGDKSDVNEGQQNNLDKNGPATVKNYVKNINVSSDESNAAEGGQVDLGEVQRLMERAAGQLEQDAQRELQGLKQDKELMERLAQVSQRHSNTGEQAKDSTVDNEEEEDSEDEEKAAQKVLLQYLAEAKLDEKVGPDLATSSKDAASTSKHSASAQAKGGKESEVDSDYEDPDELPFCIICTEDAAVRCIDCDMDLYCSKCFRDGHKELGLGDHRSVPFKMPKGYS